MGLCRAWRLKDHLSLSSEKSQYLADPLAPACLSLVSGGGSPGSLGASPAGRNPGVDHGCSINNYG